MELSSILNHIVLWFSFSGYTYFVRTSVGSVFELLIAALAILNDPSIFPCKSSKNAA